jgi:L-alanine-DL-glutamate epimerase-like enolase superfamily enzyme
VKIKVGELWGECEERDLARVALARRTAGDRKDLMMDANGEYASGQAVRMGHPLAALDVGWSEEPAFSVDLAGLPSVRDRVASDAAAREYGYNLSYFARMSRAVDCVQAHATRCGGYTQWLRGATVAARNDGPVSGQCAPYATAVVAAVTPNLRHLEWLHERVSIDQRFFEGADDPVESHGLTLRRKEVEATRVA